MTLQTLLPDGWKAPIGYANGIVAPVRRAHRVRRRTGGLERAADLRERGTGAAVRAGAAQRADGAGAGRRPARAHLPHDGLLLRQARLPGGAQQLGAIWRQPMGNHYPAMSMIFVSDLPTTPARSN